MQQEPEQQGQGRAPETEREAAIDFLRPYVLDGWTLQELSKRPLRIDRPEYAARTGNGGSIEDEAGEPRQVKRGELVITRLGSVPCWARFEIADIKADIHDQARGYHYPRTLADLLTQEPEEPPALTTPEPKKKRPAVYRSYMGGNCENPACDAYLGHIETEGGRDRHYCSDKCRVAAHRARQREKKRAATLQYHAELRAYWQEHGLHGEVLARLQEILLQHGKKAARAATDAVLVALAAAEQAGSQEQFTLMDEIMLSGEALNFPEIRNDDFRIPAGVQGWTDFVSHTTISFLRQMRSYLYELERQAYQKAQGRKRLGELSGGAPNQDQPPRS